MARPRQWVRWLASLASLCASGFFAAPVNAQTCLSEDLRSQEPRPPALRLHWRFHTSSPISGSPVLTPEGQVYVGTHEGYVHSLSARGAFLWSYTVEGALLEQLAADELGRVYAGSSRGVVYGIERAGTPLWVYHSPARFDTQLAASPLKLLYAASGRHLYALSTRRGLLWRANLGARVSSGPISDPHGRAWLITEDNQLHVVRKPFDHRKTDVPKAEPQRLLGVTKSQVLVLSGGLLQIRGQQGQLLWTYPGVAQAAFTQQTPPDVVAVTTATPELLRLRQGQVLERHVLAARAAAAPVGTGAWLAAPGVDGQIRVISGKTLTTCRVSHAPLHQPALRNETLWVAAGDGSLVSLKFTSETYTGQWQHPGRRSPGGK